LIQSSFQIFKNYTKG